MFVYVVFCLAWPYTWYTWYVGNLLDGPGVCSVGAFLCLARRRGSERCPGLFVFVDVDGLAVLGFDVLQCVAHAAFASCSSVSISMVSRAIFTCLAVISSTCILVMRSSDLTVAVRDWRRSSSLLRSRPARWDIAHLSVVVSFIIQLYIINICEIDHSAFLICRYGVYL